MSAHPLVSENQHGYYEEEKEGYGWANAIYAEVEFTTVFWTDDLVFLVGIVLNTVDCFSVGVGVWQQMQPVKEILGKVTGHFTNRIQL